MKNSRDTNDDITDDSGDDFMPKISGNIRDSPAIFGENTEAGNTYVNKYLSPIDTVKYTRDINDNMNDVSHDDDFETVARNSRASGENVEIRNNCVNESRDINGDSMSDYTTPISSTLIQSKLFGENADVNLRNSSNRDINDDMDCDTNENDSATNIESSGEKQSHTVEKTAIFAEKSPLVTKSTISRDINAAINDVSNTATTIIFGKNVETSSTSASLIENSTAIYVAHGTLSI